MSSVYGVIRRPIMTEKSTMLAEAGKYVFEVASSVDKGVVRKAIESIFGVQVEKVNIMNVKGKTKRFRGRLGVRQGYKKAVITLKDGQEIDFVSGVK